MGGQLVQTLHTGRPHGGDVHLARGSRGHVRHLLLPTPPFETSVPLIPPETMLSALATLRPLRRAYRRYARQCLSAALLLPVVAVATGVPIPSLPSARTAERSPCERCHCGCVSADQCWRDCCCHTLAERLTWARDNDVRPPDFALAEARLVGLDVSEWLPGEDCCTSAAESTCCTERSAPAAEAVCCCHCEPAVVVVERRVTCCASVEPKAHPKTDFVVAWRAMKCNGQSLDSVAAVPMLISDRPQPAGELHFAYWLQAPASSVAAGVSHLPPVPPPERA